MPNAFDIAVQQLAAVRSAYTHIEVWRAATDAGPFAEVTTTTSRVPLTATPAYTFLDPGGSEDDYYRIRYMNARTGARSDFGPVVLGTPDPALDVISVQELRDFFLFGVDLTDDDGVPYPDAMFRFYIQSAVSWLEIRLDMPLRRQVVLAERLDYYPQEYRKWQFFQLKRRPVISVEALRYRVPGVPGSEITYPTSWLEPDLDAGTVEVVPGLGAASLAFFSGGGVLFPTLSTTGQSVPHVFECDYTAGFERGKVPGVIREIAGKVASFGPLNIAGDLVAGAGIAAESLSMDGVAQSVTTTNSSTNAGYGARLLQYRKEIAEQLPRLYTYYHAINAFAV